MTAFERWCLRVGFCLATATGVVYGWLRYFGGAQGEFGPEPSAWQSPWQHAHVLAAPLLVFALGLATRGHALAMLQVRSRSGRATGLLLLAVMVPLVLGGYAVQVVTAAAPRGVLGWAHAGVGVLFAFVYLGHWAKRRAAVSGRARTLEPSARAFSSLTRRARSVRARIHL
jgi:hypothetical protein